MADLEDIVKRLEILEAAVFPKDGSARILKKNEHTGLAGGLRLIISDDFFSKKRTATEAREELAGRGYHYPIAAVQTALNRVSTKTGALTAFVEGGKKIYVKRK